MEGEKRLSSVAKRFVPSPIQQFSLLAQQCNAINLAEGFPDFPAPLTLKNAAVAAINSDFNQYRFILLLHTLPCLALPFIFFWIAYSLMTYMLVEFLISISAVMLGDVTRNLDLIFFVVLGVVGSDVTISILTFFFFFFCPPQKTLLYYSQTCSCKNSFIYVKSTSK